MTTIPSSRLVRELIALRAAGVTSFQVRQRMIMLAHLRKNNFAAWVEYRGSLTVFDVIEVGGEEMQERLLDGDGAFGRDEIMPSECAK